MKQHRGIWLPDNDTHFAEHLDAGPEYQGAGTYQFKKIEMALARVEQWRGAVDVGAHVGLWSRVLADKFETLWAFEPVPEHQACFVKNLTEYKAGKNPRIVLHPVALGSAAGHTFIDPVPNNSGNACVTDHHLKGIKVQLRTLDSFRLFEKHVDFIKIDVEGYELEVIKGGEETIRKCRPVMVIEQKPGHAQRYGFGERAAVNVVLAWGAELLWHRAGDYCLGWKN